MKIDVKRTVQALQQNQPEIYNALKRCADAGYSHAKVSDIASKYVDTEEEMAAVMVVYSYLRD